jgi:hypothetical protein
MSQTPGCIATRRAGATAPRRSLDICRRGVLGCIVSLALAQGAPGQSAGIADRPVAQADGAEARLAVRSGDPAPIAAPFGWFDCRLAVAPGGGLLFVDAFQSALFLKEGETTRTLAYAGQAAPGGGRFASLCEAAVGDDGTIAFRAILADGREGVFRIAPGGAYLEEVLRTGTVLALHRGPSTLGVISGPTVDGSGAVVLAADFLEAAGAILRVAPGSAPAVLLQTGDSLAGGTFMRSLGAPAANPSGRIVFTAALTSGTHVVGTVAPGESPAVLFVAAPGRFVSPIPPAINDAGAVAFLWSDRGSLRVQKVAGGLSTTVAAPGSPAPGSGSFFFIADLEPAIDAQGRVLFGAVRSDFRAGIFLAHDQTTVVALEGMEIEGGETLSLIGDPGVSPVFRPDGSVLFGAVTTAASGLASRSGEAIRFVVRSEDPVPGPARFVSFLERSVTEGTGPSLAQGGALLFDARVTGGTRGLFVKRRAGEIAAVAWEGGPAPGDRRFEEFLAFHSINEAGAVAFLGSATGPESGPDTALYLWTPGGGAPRRILGSGDTEPGGDRSILDLQPPSRLNRLGQIAVPVTLSDGREALLGYDGASLFRVVEAGDPAPGGAFFTRIFTGSFFTGARLPPALDDGGRLVFGALTGGLDAALYAARLAPGGGGVPERVLGAGDTVEGAPLSPFEIQALDLDAEGRLAFEAVYNEDFDFGTFLKEGSSLLAVAREFDPVPALDSFVRSVTPRLALLGGGRLAYGVTILDGSEAILLRDAAPGAERSVIAAAGLPSPDGGTYLFFESQEGGARIASDGNGGLAFAAATDEGPEGVFLFGVPQNSAPLADAGGDFAVECAGPAGTEVTLDAGGSSDSDGDDLSYVWTGPFGRVEGPRPTVSLLLGVSTITLVVSDGEDDSEPDTIVIEVRDTLAPALEVAAAPALLWPPDGRLVEVGFLVAASDRCDPSPAIALIEAASSEEEGAGRSGAPIVGADPGTYDRSISLRADRSGGGPGRTYTITYRAADSSGNAAIAAAIVQVPHDQRR